MEKVSGQSLMYLLIEIRDGTRPHNINKETLVDLDGFKELESALIYAEPPHLGVADEDTFVIVSEDGEFGVVPRTTDIYFPELERKWTNLELATFFFDRFKREQG